MTPVPKQRERWSRWPDSNRRHDAYEAPALPTELHRHAPRRAATHRIFYGTAERQHNPPRPASCLPFIPEKGGTHALHHHCRYRHSAASRLRLWSRPIHVAQGARTPDCSPGDMLPGSLPVASIRASFWSRGNRLTRRSARNAALLVSKAQAASSSTGNNPLV